MLTQVYPLQPFGVGLVISDAFVVQSDHSVHYINVNPVDELLYVPQGSPSNTGPCNAVGDIRQCAINRMQLNGSDAEPYVIGELSPTCMSAEQLVQAAITDSHGCQVTLSNHR